MTTFDNRTIIIPNSKLSNEVIVNLSRQGTRRMDIELKFPFDKDYSDVKDSIEQSIRATENLLAEPAHRIGLLAIDPDGYRVLLNVWAPAHGYQDTKLGLQERLLRELREQAILGAVAKP